MRRQLAVLCRIASRTPQQTREQKTPLACDSKRERPQSVSRAATELDPQAVINHTSFHCKALVQPSSVCRLCPLPCAGVFGGPAGTSGTDGNRHGSSSTTTPCLGEDPTCSALQLSAACSACVLQRSLLLVDLTGHDVTDDKAVSHQFESRRNFFLAIPLH